MAETVLPGELLTQEEIRIISACLLAAEEGPFFSDWEFQTLFGVERPVLRNVRLHWPHVSLSDWGSTGLSVQFSRASLSLPAW